MRWMAGTQLSLIKCPNCGTEIDLNNKQEQVWDEQIERANQERKAKWGEYLNYKGPDWKPKLQVAVDAENAYISLVKEHSDKVVV